MAWSVAAGEVFASSLDGADWPGAAEAPLDGVCALESVCAQVLAATVDSRNIRNIRLKIFSLDYCSRDHDGVTRLKLDILCSIFAFNHFLVIKGEAGLPSVGILPQDIDIFLFGKIAESPCERYGV